MFKLNFLSGGGQSAGTETALVVAVAFMIGFFGSATMSQLDPPEARVNNELAHQLAGDTFASGRLSNPTHNHAEFFEAVHVLQQPSYMSKLPPAVGAFLAAGQFATGKQQAGMWLANGLALAAIGWALLALFPARWAMVGVGLVAVGFGIYHPESRAFRGAMVGALGGALMIGGVARLYRGQATRWGWIMAAVLMCVGVILLANSRPFEGLIMAAPAAVAVLVWLVRGPKSVFQRWLQVALPGSLVLLIGLALMLQYNRAVTGDSLTFPYSAYEQQYTNIPTFLWQDFQTVPPIQRPHMQRYQQWQQQRVQRLKDAGVVGSIGLKTERLWRVMRQSWLGKFWFLPLLLLPLVWRQRWVQFSLASLLLVIFSHYLILPFRVDMLAPATVLYMIVLIAGLQKLSLWGQAKSAKADGLQLPRQWSWGMMLVAVLLATVVLLNAWRSAVIFRYRTSVDTPVSPQTSVSQQLGKQPGQHLVFVRFSPNSSGQELWAYNGANIDQQKVVYANDLGANKNWQLVEYYQVRNQPRQLWLQAHNQQGEAEPLQPYTPP